MTMVHVTTSAVTVSPMMHMATTAMTVTTAMTSAAMLGEGLRWQHERSENSENQKNFADHSVTSLRDLPLIQLRQRTIVFPDNT